MDLYGGMALSRKLGCWKGADTLEPLTLAGLGCLCPFAWRPGLGSAIVTVGKSGHLPNTRCSHPENGPTLRGLTGGGHHGSIKPGPGAGGWGRGWTKSELPTLFSKKGSSYLVFWRSYFSNTFCFKVTLNWERPRCWERLRTGEEGDRG